MIDDYQPSEDALLLLPQPGRFRDTWMQAHLKQKIPQDNPPLVL